VVKRKGRLRGLFRYPLEPHNLSASP